MKIHDRHYINGAWVPSSEPSSIEVRSAATEEVIAHVPAGAAEDADKAVKAARSAFESWAATPVSKRAAYLKSMADGLAARADEVARTITAEVGMPLKLSQRVQAALPRQVMASYAQLLGEFQFEERVANSLVLKEPVGVVGAITPWNYSLHQILG